jgi:hypothetical protein
MLPTLPFAIIAAIGRPGPGGAGERRRRGGPAISV